MSKIKKYFSRKKNDAAFKLNLNVGFGQGRTLNDSNQPSGSQRKMTYEEYVPPERKELSNEAKSAASAALSRLEKMSSKEFNTSLAAIKAQAKRELEAERKLKNQTNNSDVPKSNNKQSGVRSPSYSVFFRCPFISDEVMSKNEWKIKIKNFLYQQLEAERALTACLIIRNCNTKEKAEDCVETLIKYLENLINHPNEEKYRKIRTSNRIFCEKVRYTEGALDFLLAVGFRECDIDGDQYLLWSSGNIEQDQNLIDLKEALKNAEQLTLELDRNIKVLLPSQASHVELGSDFYRVTPEDIKREQLLKTEALENSQILKTKAMREREEQRALRVYRYTLIRIKFPNCMYLQGTFHVYEKLSDVYEFVQSCLNDESLEFKLTISFTLDFCHDDRNKTLYELKLVPNITLLFNAFDKRISSPSEVNFLKDDLLLLVQYI